MKIEFTKEEIKAIILTHANKVAPSSWAMQFDTVEAGSYGSIPLSFIVSTKEDEDAAQ